ncbi:MAG TPA: hypothetical protein VIY28_01765 [Pseudonocardiaceae bacterium]
MPRISVGAENSGAHHLPGLFKGITHVVIEGVPHAIAWTHTDQVNRRLSQVVAD